MNHNICEKCIDTKLTPSILVADTGVCGKCGNANDVWDLDVIRLYKAQGVSDMKIWKYLPRLRSSVLSTTDQASYTIDDIREKLQNLLSIN